MDQHPPWRVSYLHGIFKPGEEVTSFKIIFELNFIIKLKYRKKLEK